MSNLRMSESSTTTSPRSPSTQGGRSVHLIEILSLRQTSAAGCYLSLTRRCPLSCAHCSTSSTSSTLSSEEHSGAVFQRLVDTFTATSRPDVIVLTGGEPLLRPQLVRDLTERAHGAGTRVVLASGMFFARGARIPPTIDRVIAEVDHLTASLDVFHEQQVPRAAVFDVLRRLIDRGQEVSLQVVGMDEQDPYLANVAKDIRCSFHDRVPAMVGVVRPKGRARAWLEPCDEPAADAEEPEPSPCEQAAWPVVSYDGTVLACCNANTSAPPHLQLGQTAVDDWQSIRQRCLKAPLLRAIRMFGPRYVAHRYGDGAVSCDGYCATCHKLSDTPAIAGRLQAAMDRSTTQLMEEHISRLRHEHFLSSHGPPAYAHLAQLGYDGESTTASAVSRV